MTALQQISADFRRLGIPLPKPLAAAQAAADKFLAAVPREVGNPVGAALDAIERGDDPYGPEVQRQIAMYRLTELNLPNAARLRSDGKVDDALAANADAILDALACHLVPHAEAMAAAHQLGVTDLHEARTLRGAQLVPGGTQPPLPNNSPSSTKSSAPCSAPYTDRHPTSCWSWRTASSAQLQIARDATARDNRPAREWALARPVYPSNPSPPWPT